MLRHANTADEPPLNVRSRILSENHAVLGGHRAGVLGTADSRGSVVGSTLKRGIASKVRREDLETHLDRVVAVLAAL